MCLASYFLDLGLFYLSIQSYIYQFHPFTCIDIHFLITRFSLVKSLSPKKSSKPKWWILAQPALCYLISSFFWVFQNNKIFKTTTKQFESGQLSHKGEWEGESQKWIRRASSLFAWYYFVIPGHCRESNSWQHTSNNFPFLIFFC